MSYPSHQKFLSALRLAQKLVVEKNSLRKETWGGFDSMHQRVYFCDWKLEKIVTPLEMIETEKSTKQD